MKKIWQNYLTGGCDPNEISQTLLNQVKFFNFFSLVGIISTLIFCLMHLFAGNFLVGFSELAGIGLAVVNIIYFRLSLNFKIATHILLLLMVAILVFLLITGGFQGTGIFWYFTFPALAFFLKGKLQGLLYLLLLYGFSIAGYLLYHYGLITNFYYNFVQIRQMLSSLAAVSLLVFYYEKTKTENEEKITKNEKEMLIKYLFDRQLEEAGEIQRTFIPHNTHTSEFMEIAGYYKPAMEIGGDYFDIFPLEVHRTGVIIADVSNKGIPAALVMVKFRTIIKMISDLKSVNPSQLFSILNKKISGEIMDHMFITSMYLIINHNTSQIEFSNAGHIPLTLYSAAEKEVKTIDAKEFPIGISADQEFRDYTRQVRPGDILVLYTDGISEMKNHHKERYGIERLHLQIKKYVDLSAKEISDKIIQDVFYFNKGGDQNDDIALVVIKIQ